MKKDSAIALAILCGLLALQPFLYDGFGSAISIIPIVAFAAVMLYFALWPKPDDSKENKPAQARRAKRGKR